MGEVGDWTGLILMVAFVTIRVLLTPDKPKEDEVPERENSNEYDSASADECIKVKMQCLELAVQVAKIRGDGYAPKDIINDAQKYWDFISLEPETDE